MKLKTKVIWITCLAVMVISLAGDAVILGLTQRSFMNEAESRGYQKAYLVVDELKQVVTQKGSLDYNDEVIQYFFKKQGDDYNLCFREQSSNNNDASGKLTYHEIYNHTVFELKMLQNLKYRKDINSSWECADFAYGGKHFLVYSGAVGGNLIVFHIEDITYVWERLDLLMACMAAITLAMLALAFVVISVILKRVLQPLQELNDSARAVADGMYDKRLEILSRDEIGQLGENFNKMAEAIETRTHSLEESEQKKTLLMGNLTHELKTPMTAISGYAKTLLTVKLDDEDREEALLYIYEACGRLERLSKKMMKLLALEGDAELDIKEVPVKRLFDVAAKSCEMMLQEKNVTLECYEQGEVFHVDEDLMTDVLINLVDNAVKASKAGDRVIMRAEAGIIHVQDFGVGIPEEEKDKILEPFYMIDKSRSRKNGGAGLGLALTVLIVRQHHARLLIESEVGKGTDMILQFV